MAKFLLFVAVLAALYILFVASRRTSSPPPESKPGLQEMVRCAHCGVHFPRVESIDAGGRKYCCDEHRRLGGDP